MTDCSAHTSGPWTTAGTWAGSPGTVPTDGQSVTIESGVTVTFNDDHGPMGKAWTTGINGIVMTDATSVLIFSTAVPTYLMMKTGTNISGTGGIVNIGSGAVNSATAIPRGSAVTQALNNTANAGLNATIPIANTTGFAVGATIYIVAGAESGSPPTSTRETQTIKTVTTNTSLTVNGTLANTYYVASGAYVTQLNKPGATIDFHGAGSTAAIAATGTHTINGAIPTTPAAHPAYTMLHADAVVGQGYVDIEDSDFSIQAGEQVLISSPSTAADGVNNLYTCTKYEATGGAEGKPRIHIYPVISSTPNASRAGGHTGAANNDYVALYSRPILITRAAWNATVVIPAQSGSTFSGVRFLNTPFIALSNNTYSGVTFHSTQYTAYMVNQANVTTGYTSVYNDVVTGPPKGLMTAYGYNEYASGCIHIGLTTEPYNGVRAMTFSNCILASSNKSFLINSYGGKFSNCVCRYVTSGLYGLPSGLGYAPEILSGVSTVGTSCTDITLSNAVISTFGPVYCYNCTFGSDTTIANYAYVSRPVMAVMQSWNQGGTANSNYLWCKGGIGTTDQTTLNYAEAKGTMKFTTDSVAYETPIIWDTPFWMPGNNRSITFTVPMYATSGQDIAMAVQIIDPANDPLWFTQFPSAAYSLTSVGTARGNALAATALSAVDSAWHSAAITVPGQSYPRKLICRIIALTQSTGVSQIGYAYLTNMNNALMQFTRRFA
jgi:hypothetical protein